MGNPFCDPDPSQNPYANFSTVNPGGYPVRVGGGMVSHVRVVGILMIVQGALALMMGLGLIGMGFVMPVLMSKDPNLQRQMANGPPMWIFPAIYGGLGAVVTILSLVLIVAGVKNFRFRSRLLGIVSISLGVLASFTCYCAPTAIGLLIYGLIVYLNPAVVAAFEMGRQGRSADEILAASYAGMMPK